MTTRSPDPTRNLTAVTAARLMRARTAFFEQGETPVGLVEPVILRSWERCRHAGLPARPHDAAPDPLPAHLLRSEQARNHHLLLQGRPILAQVYDEIRDSGSMVILADAQGVLLETLGDADFVGRAGRIALKAGARWDEGLRGTNAIGTALCEERALMVLGGEHFMAHNGFLGCCASPVFGPDGSLTGVLDISGDARSHQGHTLGLARFAAAVLEKRLFETLHGQDILIGFHPDEAGLGSPREGLMAVSPEGQVLAINASGLALLGSRRPDTVRRDFSAVTGTPLAVLIDAQRRAGGVAQRVVMGRQTLALQLRGTLPARRLAGHVFDVAAPGSPAAPSFTTATPPPVPASTPSLPVSGGVGAATVPYPAPTPCRRTDASTAPATLAQLDTGDPQMHRAIVRAQRIVGRDIPILLHGESGCGKDRFARAMHRSGPRRDGPFVALNCASIPETLIESELFGYQGGAFTGARREGAIGRIQQAHGGTLFLDEIGDMPLHLQARLLRVLQERCVTPLGSSRTIEVDIALVGATHRRLREEVAAGRFREDLYYRLNGLTLQLPPLRERTDLAVLLDQITRDESRGRPYPVQYSEEALAAIHRYPWPGNLRELANVVRVTLALLDDDATEITLTDLPEEWFEEVALTAAAAPPASAMPPPAHVHAAPILSSSTRLQDLTRQAAREALEQHAGNVSAAARQLGISRNTLYRKLGRM